MYLYIYISPRRRLVKEGDKESGVRGSVVPSDVSHQPWVMGRAQTQAGGVT